MFPDSLLTSETYLWHIQIVVSDLGPIGVPFVTFVPVFFHVPRPVIL